jgi:spermidine synthase
VGDVTPADGAALGAAELLADADRPGGWLLLVDRIRQSYVDLEDPSYLDFEYMQAFADVLGVQPPGPLAVTHIGGGACAFARYVAATRPGSPQIVLEPDAQLIAFVRARLPLPRSARVRIRPVGGRDGIAGMRPASADVVVLDAFNGGRVPAELATVEFFADVARVLRPSGVLLANVADGGDARYSRRLAAAIRTALPHLVVVADPAVLKGRRFGNLVLAASRQPLPVTQIRQATARAPFPRRVRDRFGADAKPLTDADPMRSPAPPDKSWRVADLEDFD